MDKDAAEDVGEEINVVDEDAAEEVVEEVATHIKMGLTSHMSPVTLKMRSGLHSRTRQEKG